MAEKFSKKASSNIISFAQAIDPNASKLISYNEAWDIISEYGGITGGLYTQHNKKHSLTTFDIIKESNDEIIHSFSWKNEDVFNEGDWDWTKIFKEVLEYILKNKIVKKPRSKKPSKTHQISKETEKMNKLSSSKLNSVKSQENTVKFDSMSIDELKRKKTALYSQIYDWRKKGKDATKLINEYNELSKYLKR